MSTSLPSLQGRVGEKRGWGVDGDEGRARKDGVCRQVVEGGSAGTVVMWEGEWVSAEGSWRVKVRLSLLRWPGMSQGWKCNTMQLVLSLADEGETTQSLCSDPSTGCQSHLGLSTKFHPLLS